MQRLDSLPNESVQKTCLWTTAKTISKAYRLFAWQDMLSTSYYQPNTDLIKGTIITWIDDHNKALYLSASSPCNWCQTERHWRMHLQNKKDKEIYNRTCCSSNQAYYNESTHIIILMIKHDLYNAHYLWFPHQQRTDKN